MIVEVDTSSPVPPYEQIRDQVTTMAVVGVLPVGARLPAICQLAADLGLANGTVARAYRELETAGVIASRGRHGRFVRGDRLPAADPKQLHERARAFAVAVQQLGVDHAEALSAVRHALAGMETS